MREVKELIASVRKLAEDYPQAVYTRSGAPGQADCDNVRGKVMLHDGGFLPDEGCLIGQAIRRTWADDETRETLLRHHSSPVHLVLSHLAVAGDFYDSRWLSTVQMYQDSGLCWGEAVMRADERMEEAQ